MTRKRSAESQKNWEKRQEMKADPKRWAEYREAQTTRARHRHWKVKYGLTPEQVIQLWDNQDGECGICSIPLLDFRNLTAESRPLNTFPQLDHDHETGKPRQFLCRSCNTKLGWYERHMDEIEEYLLRNQT